MGFELTTLVVIGTDCTGSCEFNYHAIRTPLNTEVMSLFVVLHLTLKVVSSSYSTHGYSRIALVNKPGYKS